MSYRTVPFCEIPAQDWDAFAAESDEAWIWHRSAICGGLGLWPDYSNESFAVLDDTRRICATAPLHKTGSSRAWLPPILNSFGGPAIHARYSGRQRVAIVEYLVEALDQAAAKHKAKWTYARVPSLTPAHLCGPGWSPSPLVRFGFDDRSEATWLVDLRPSESKIRSGYSQLTRRELKGASDEISVREAAGTKDLETYFELHRETYARSGLPPHPFDYFRMIFENLIPAGLTRVLFAERKDRVVAAQNTALWKGGAIYNTGASLSEKQGGENRLLFDQQIMRAKADGCAFYETGQAYLGRASAKEEGLSRFKASFGSLLARQPAGRKIAAGFAARLAGAVSDFRSAFYARA